MRGITFKHTGDFSFPKTEKFFNRLLRRDYMDILPKYAQQGVDALSDATPKDTGLTAASWSYEIIQNADSISIFFNNSNVVDGYYNVAILLQFGHGTRNGGYVAGRDYINPAILPVLEKIAKNAWEEVTIT